MKNHATYHVEFTQIFAEKHVYAAETVCVLYVRLDCDVMLFFSSSVMGHIYVRAARLNFLANGSGALTKQVAGLV